MSRRHKDALLYVNDPAVKGGGSIRYQTCRRLSTCSVFTDDDAAIVRHARVASTIRRDCEKNAGTKSESSRPLDVSKRSICMAFSRRTG